MDKNKNKSLLTWGPGDPIKNTEPVKTDSEKTNNLDPVQKKKRGKEKKNYATFYLKEETIEIIERAVYWEGKKLKDFSKGELIDLLLKDLQDKKQYQEIPKQSEERKLF